MWTKNERAVLQDLFDSAIGSDNTDYILEKLSAIYNMIYNTQIARMYMIDMKEKKIVFIGDKEKRNFELIAKEKELGA